MKLFIRAGFYCCLFVLAMFTSCTKPDVKGCMDKNSTNYNADATVDDGSCHYSSQVLIWWGQAVAQECQTNSLPTMNVTIDGEFKGAVAISGQYFLSQPSCGATGAFTSTIDLGSSKTKTISIKIDLLDANGNIFGTQTETHTVSANLCNQYEIQP